MSINFQQKTSCQLVRGPESKARHNLHPKGRFTFDHYRDGVRIDSKAFDNGIVNEGKNHLLDATFDNATSYATWYCGLLDIGGYSALASDDAYTDIDGAGNGWDEFTAYTDANNSNSAITRPEWQTDSASGQSITNSTTSIYDITANGTVKGLFIVGGANGAVNKSDSEGTGNILWSTALFGSGDVAVLNGDQLKITYTISA